VQIAGDEAALHHLALHTAGRDPEIAQHPQGFWLRSRRFDSLIEPWDVHAEAERMTAAISGFARLELGSPVSLRAGNIERVDGTGAVHSHLMAEGFQVNIRMGFMTPTVTHADGTVEILPSGRERQVEALFAEPDMEKAMRLRDLADPQWGDLYKIYELIRDMAGGKSELVRRGWAPSEKFVERFTRTANSATAAGDQARHGVETAQPPADPMKLEEGRAFIDGLVQSSLGWVAAGRPA
jgi:hypothetical protein